MHKPEHGRIARVSALSLMLGLSGFGFFGLQQFLAAYGLAEGSWVLTNVSGMDVTLSHAIAAVLSLAMLLTSVWVCLFHPKAGDFLAEVEGEMRKSVWPLNMEAKGFMDKTHELRMSSTVVVFVVIFMAIVLACLDFGFERLMRVVL
ncbi:MAG: preprotein translocase subunit SecE [Planctomycetota bacterium]